MKKTVFLAFLIAIISCKKEAPIEYAIISGKITNANSDKIMLYNQYNPEEKREITLAENGSFIDTIFIDKSDAFGLRQNRNGVRLFLNKGDHLTINFNAKKLDSTLLITGKGNEISNYLLKKRKIGKELRGKTKDLYSKTEKEFLEALSKLKTAEQDLLFGSEVPEEYKKNESKNINFEYLFSLNNYKDYHSYFTKNKEFKTSEDFLDELKDFDVSNENDFKFSSNYRNLVSSYYNKESEKLIKSDSSEQDIAELKTLASIKNETIKNKLLHDNAIYGITYTNNLEDFYTIFSNASTDAKSNAEITKIYNNLKALSKGNTSPKFVNYENNAGGTTSLDDLKGKYVYIDVWATWCGPCIAEIPSLKKVEKQYHTKNIEFVSLSIDNKKDYEKWKKMIVSKELAGTQLFADNNWDSKFVKEYQIKGIPRFILIDPKGNIVNANAPRPSDSKLIDLFNELNI